MAPPATPGGRRGSAKGRGLLVAAAAVAWLSAAPGCATVAPSSKLQERVVKSGMKPEELRVRVRALVIPYSGRLEALADELVALSPDPRTQAAMTRFKTNGIPAMQLALFRRDPLAALVDSWALLVQMQLVLNRLPGVLNPQAKALAERELRSMEAQHAELWRRVTGQQDASATAERVHTWAAQHPVQGNFAARESTTQLLAGLTATPSLSALAAAGSLLQETQDLTDRLDAATTFLPKQARWEAETMLLEVLMKKSFHPSIPEFASLTDQVGRIPELVDRERAASFASIDAQREELQEYLTGERKALLSEMDRMGSRWVDQGFDRMDALVDRIFVRLLILLGLAGLTALALVLFETRARRRDRARQWQEREGVAAAGSAR